MPQKPPSLMDILQYQWGISPEQVMQLQGMQQAPQGPGAGFLPQSPVPYGPPSVNMPVGLGEETRPMPAGVGQPPPDPSGLMAFAQHNPLSQWFGTAYQDVAADPMGAITEGLPQFFGAPGGLLGGLHATSAMAQSPGAPAGSVRAVRGMTQEGARKNAWEGVQFKASKAREAEVDAKDWANLPSHLVQEKVRLPNGQMRFGKIPPEVKAARERGAKLRDVERRSAEKYPGGHNDPKLRDYIPD
jgi:hypothetical protein